MKSHGSLNRRMSLIDRVLPASFRENRLIAPQHFIVLQSIRFIRCLRDSSDVLSTNMLDYVSDVVVLMTSHSTTRSHHNLITTPAEVLFVMDQEILASLQPHSNLVPPSVGGNANL